MKTHIVTGIAGIVLLACGMTLPGCSGLDDLKVRNNYSFTIRLRYKAGGKKDKLIGVVPAHSSGSFAGAAGYDAGKVDYIKYENEQGKTLGALSRSGPNAGKRENVSRFNGAATWSVSVGPQTVPAQETRTA